jgi:hypothetical protein
MKRYLLVFFVLAVVSASAVPYDLYTLVNSHSGSSTCFLGANCFDVGGLQFVFTSATLTPVGAIGVTPTPPLAVGQFSVIPEAAAGLNGFDIQGVLSATVIGTGPVSTSTIDLALGYSVTTLSGAATMTDLHGFFDALCGVTVPVGGCDINLSETAVNDLKNNVLTVNPLALSQSTPNVTDLFLAPQNSLDIGKDIKVEAIAGPGGIVTGSLSIVDQYVSSQVPEPGFYGALALGLSGLTLAVRRRRRAV